MKKKHIFLISAISLLSFFLFAEEQINKAAQVSLPDTTTLLLSYVENDTELKNLTIAAKNLHWLINQL